MSSAQSLLLLSSGALALALATTAVEPRAHADPSTTERALATVLFNEGRELMTQGSFSKACPKFAESQRLDPGGGTLLNLAICHEREGKPATAWAELNDALAIALREEREDREAIAREHLAAVEPRLARLRPVVPPASAVAGLEVTLDGAPVRSASWGIAVPVDPGRHALEAHAPGRAPWARSVDVSEGALVSIELPPLADAPAPSAPVSIAPVSIAPAPPASPPPRANLRRTAGWVLGGLGVAAVIAGGVAGAVALEEEGAARDKCLPTTCPDQTSLAHSQTASTAARVSDVALVGGVVASGLGVLLVLVSPAPKGSSSVRAVLTPADRGIVLQGRF